ncbi:MAG TPA: SWIM zinc finger family protein [Desulfobacteraceae bacterium]|nr:SWIM zinc finger family protein [Desulfobacteraceae bacterium]
MSRYNHYGFPRYVPVGERKAKAEKKIRQLRKKQPDILPVQIEGRKIASSWWGSSWNKNLESYADYSNRIGRGRSYVRHSAVLDLKIQPGRITSLVQGSTSKPYTVVVTIKQISADFWDRIIKRCQGETESLNDLVSGTLPKTMADILTRKKEGMFPSPSEIVFTCSCPDSAYMCKHVAATLYGVGARFDHDPSLLFSLRGVRMEDLVSRAVQQEADRLIKKAGKGTSKRIIQDADLSSEFGIDFDDAAVPDKASPGPSRQKQAKKPAGKTAVKREKPAVGRKKQNPAKTAEKEPAKSSNQAAPFETVVKLIERRRVNPVGVKEIQQRTGFGETFIRNCIFRAKQKGRIKNQARGLYMKA